METMPKSRNMFAIFGNLMIQTSRCRISKALARVHTHGNILVQFDSLFARPTMNITQNIHSTGHRVIQPDPAGRSHSRDCDTRCLRAVIDCRDKRGLKQCCLSL
eukprot:NODE_7488_length_589_cov_1.229437_g7465_i0.p4 GENE.NODE_7488_length_589_cov_1.229437_g7465_i0~~NODE_7488_length_589_cov_1.229437_g7465_i0.p4  ORF type:complete len:104 (-),score=9.70 NODE_7488_length_589_cov_1.229437_g7465_i0:129-440(-)